MLREEYFFERLPNDYFVAKPHLPRDTSKIRTIDNFTYPITEKLEAKKFIQQIKPWYKFSLPLPLYIMSVNPTDKPDLPEDPQQITQYNLTLPITTPKALVETARLLRETYYFYRIPTTWIQIDQQAKQSQPNKTTNNTQNKPNIPQTLTELQEELEKITESIYINIPISQQEDITNTLIIL